MKNSLLLFFALFICSLVAGYTFSARFYPSNFSLLNSSLKVVTAKEQKPIDALSTGQRSLLLITTSSLSTLDTHLESIWLATYLPTSSDLRLLPIYPSGTRLVSDFETQLVRSYGLSRQNGQLALKQDFLTVLENANYWWSGYIVLDEVAVAGIFDQLGGLEIKNQTLSGEQVLSESPKALEQPGEAYAFQIAVLQSVCNHFTQVALDIELSDVNSTLHRHILTDLLPEQLSAEFQTLLTDDRQLTCKFPLLEKSQVVH